MKNFMSEVAVLFSYPKNLIKLVIRLILSYGFATPALLKINNLEDTVTWFESMAIPVPLLSTYLVSSIETMGIVLLFLGLFTRYISILLSCVMLGAIFFVHIENGFSVANNGLEIPLYYLLFLVFLASFGAGKYSLDRVLFKDGLHD
ncbi:DoxX family protein [Sulfurovum sp. XGS-02]|uniref:DoxX family protein n=1 Tax=Sulfurovum sp. XGS-02 TaxID=2925411 RepID=UPI002048BFD3|nr:DoxX family protein [Sulfurovum sp. XGS-02]UPT76579.1 DoxX family protein [Sulfurovum sp. XGS-02]